MKEINLSEILNKHLSACYITHNIQISDKYHTYLIAAMREVAEKTLELATENMKLKEFIITPQDIDTISNDMGDIYGIDKQSILNTINQIK